MRSNSVIRSRLARALRMIGRMWNGISLRTKITGVTTLLLAIGLAVAGVGTANALHGNLIDQTDQQLDSAFADIGTVNISNPGPDYSNRAPYYIAIISTDGGVVGTNIGDDTSAGPELNGLAVGSMATTGAGQTVSSVSGNSQWRLKAYGPTRGQLNGGTVMTVTVVVGESLAATDQTVARYAIIFFGFAIAVVILGAAMTQLLVTSAFAPLRDVERTAARFAAGDYSQRLGGATPNTEVGRLNRSLNAMLARIDAASSDRARTIDQMRRFVGDASHELRTPLVSLRGYAELYRMGALQKPEDVAQAMDRIEREAIRMSGLVTDLLELARLDEARPPQLAPLDLLPIAHDAALDTSASYPGRRITVVVPDHSDDDIMLPVFEGPVAAAAIQNGMEATITGPIAFAGAALGRLRRRPRGPRAEAEELPVLPVLPLPAQGPIVLAEENKIRQVVTNLMGNAMRFTPENSPIELVVDVDQAGGFGSISVVDHGEGIPPQLREKIFQRFFRADSSRTRDTGGSGLGLAIVAGIVANHRGHVEVLETPGGGATFRVSLPLLPSDHATDALPESVPEAPERATPS